VHINYGGNARRLLGSTAICLALAVPATRAHAQTVPTDSAQSAASEQSTGPAQASEDIVVTGSYIRGTPRNGASPVTVLSSQDLLKTGSPTIADLARALPVSSGSDGEANNFTSPQLEGTSNINLRGLGPARTLVLWNGRRIAQNPVGTIDGQFFVDTNLLPLAAVQRIEILKDGAAALYGSDAVAGVVNFISNNRLKGLVVSGDYRKFDGSDGDWTASAAYGWQGDRTSILASFGYQHRSEAKIRNFPWALGPASKSFENGYSTTGNPGVIRPVSGPGAVADPGCAVVGGTQGPDYCYIQVTQFENLVEEENRYQAYLEATHDFGTVKAHFEGLYARTSVPHVRTSPSFPPSRPTFFVPAASPGLVALLADNPQLVAANPFLQPAAIAAAGGVNVTARPFGNGGNPLYDYGGGVGSRDTQTYRISGELSGDLTSDIDWSVAATYQSIQLESFQPDTYAQRFTAAVRGLGGPNCTGSTPGANGCVYFNPFSNAIAQGAINGQVNPQYQPALANSLDLVRWLSGERGSRPRSQAFVVDALVRGKTGIDLPGGEIGFAAGLQYRKDWFSNSGANADSDATLNPCPTPGDQTCTSHTGVFSFGGPIVRVNASRDVKAAFAELNLPLLQGVESQLALRYEDYGAGVGSTVNPKAAARWEVFKGVVLRGSVGTTFRGPQLSQLSGTITTNQLIASTGTFKAVDTNGNPNLRPEKAFSYNLGTVVERGGFRASLDYYNFHFKSPIIVEPYSFIIANVLAGLSSGQPSPLLNRVTFVDANGNGINDPSEIERVSISYVNGPDVRTDGLDGSVEYRFDLGPHSIRIGADASYVFHYNVDATYVSGLLVAPAFDGVDRLNLTTAFVRPIPRWKGNAFIEFGGETFNVRYTLRHTDGYRNEKFDATPTVLGASISSFTTHDLNAFVRLPWDTTLSFSAINFTNKKPPYVRRELNYDTYTAYPYGRTFKIGLTKTF
jgi:iron complex outermembrane recepter protein